jgi:hypothetical protein
MNASLNSFLKKPPFFFSSVTSSAMGCPPSGSGL